MASMPTRRTSGPALPVLRYEDGKIVSSGGKHSVVLMPASPTPTPYSDSISRISS